MIQITEITDDARQSLKVVVETGEEFSLSLEYRESQQLWFCSVSYLDTTINGLGLVASFNILRQWKNILPFGIAIRTTDVGDPYFADDFTKERAKLYVLTSDEVEQIEAGIYGV